MRVPDPRQRGPRPLVVLLLVALASTSWMAAVAAQSPSGAGFQDPQDHRLLRGLVNERTLFEDPVGDTQVSHALGPNVPGPYADLADVTKVAAAETPTSLVFSIYHLAYDARASTVSEYVIYHDQVCDLFFEVPDAGLRFMVTIYGDLVLDGGESRYRAEVRRTQVERRGTETFMVTTVLRQTPVALVGGDHVEVVLDKRTFVSGSAQGDDAFPVPGTTLSTFELVCQRRLTLLVNHRDDLTNADSPENGVYAFSVSTETPALHLSFSGAAVHRDGSGEVSEAVAAAPGEVRKATLVVTNRLDDKILVDLAARLLGPDGMPAEAWRLSMAPTVEVRAHNVTEVSLFVTPPADAAHRDAVWLDVDARVLGRSDVAKRSLLLIAGRPLGPGQDTLRFHRVTEGPCQGECPTLSGTVAAPLYDGPTRFVLNTLDTDPDHGDERTTGGAMPLFAGSTLRGGLDMPLARPVRLDPDGSIEVVLALSSDMARAVDVTLHLDGDDAANIWTAHQEIQVGPETRGFTFSVRPHEGRLVVSSTLTLAVLFREAGVAGAASPDTWQEHVDWDPGASRVVLPLLPYVEPDFHLTDGLAVPSMHLLEGGSEQHVNPGKTQVVELQLVNEGTRRDDLNVEVTASDPRWAVRLEPCCRYRLEAGATAPFSVLVRPPQDAPEGEVVYVNLTATSRNDPDVRTTLSLRVIVITGIQFDEERYVPPAEGEYVPPLREDREAPALSPFWIALVVLSLSAMAGRRRGPR